MPLCRSDKKERQVTSFVRITEGEGTGQPRDGDLLSFSPPRVLLEAASPPHPKASSGFAAVGQSPLQRSGLCFWCSRSTVPPSPTPPG